MKSLVVKIYLLSKAVILFCDNEELFVSERRVCLRRIPPVNSFLES